MPILPTWLASRSRRIPATCIVLHATGGDSARGAIEWLRQIGLSYHYVIDRNGEVTKCVPVGRVAFHAGVSFGPDGPDVNRYGIGLSLANRNDGRQIYTEAQYEACKRLVAEVASANPTMRTNTTHRAIAPGRKTDPKGFDVGRVAGRLTEWGARP